MAGKGKHWASGGSRRRSSDPMSTHVGENKIPGSDYEKNKKRAMREAGIKQCRGCREYKILYKAGYCKTCRDKWLAEHGLSKCGILSSGM